MKEPKTRHTVWVGDSAWDAVETHYQKDSWSTKNEYIEKAIRFYSGYMDAEHADAYLPCMLAEVLEGKLDALGKRIGRQLFKLAVDQNIMGNLLAADLNVGLDDLRKTRVRSIKEVKETNGEIRFEDAVLYPKGVDL